MYSSIYFSRKVLEKWVCSVWNLDIESFWRLRPLLICTFYKCRLNSEVQYKIAKLSRFQCVCVCTVLYMDHVHYHFKLSLQRQLFQPQGTESNQVCVSLFKTLFIFSKCIRLYWNFRGVNKVGCFRVPALPWMWRPVSVCMPLCMCVLVFLHSYSNVCLWFKLYSWSLLGSTL